MDMEAWALEQPPSDQNGLMRAIVVENEMHVQLCWNRCLNRVEELAEFTAALSLVELPDHLTRVLPLLACMPEDEASEFVAKFLLPALDKIAKKLAEAASPYSKLMAALQGRLETEISVEVAG